jgi:hypothetical protein
MAAVGVDGAALWLATTLERRALLFASDEVAAALDDLQFTLGEGPCVRAWTGGTPVLAADLTAPESLMRWPVFAAAATAAGAVALFAFPLQVGAIRLGALELYRARAGPLSGPQLADALTFTYAAVAITLAATHPAPPGSEVAWPFGGLGEGRIEVYQATGMVAVQLGTTLAEAFVRLRAHAFTADLPLPQVARRVLQRTLRFTPDGGGGDQRS